MDLAGSITDNLSVIASYGYTDAKVLEDPDYAENRCRTYRNTPVRCS